MSNQPLDLPTRIRAAMNNDIAAMPPAVNAGLQASRNRALARLRRDPRQFLPWLPAAACAASIGALIVVMHGIPSPTQDPLSEFEAVSAATDLDLVEDLEFYEWLEKRSEVAS